MAKMIGNLLKDEVPEEVKQEARQLFGNEEKEMLLNNKGKILAVHTDSDEEMEYQEFLKTLPPPVENKNARKDIKERFKHVEGFLSEIVLKGDAQYTKTYVYENEDVEDHVKELKELYPEIKVTWQRNEDEQNIILVSYGRKFKVPINDVEKIYKKYWHQVKKKKIMIILKN